MLLDQTKFNPFRAEDPRARWYVFTNSSRELFFCLKRVNDKESREGFWGSDKELALTFTHPVPAVLFEDCLYFDHFLEQTKETATMVYHDTLEPVFPPG